MNRLLKTMLTFAAGILLAFASVVFGPAFAAEAVATVGNTVIDFTGVADLIVTTLAGILLTLASFGVRAVTRWLTTKTGIDFDNSVRTYLENALGRAIEYGRLRATEAVAERGSLKVDVKSEIIANAVSYLLNKVPDALKHFGLDQAELEEMIEARLGDWLGVEAAPVPAQQPADAAAA